jgi:hypothetical protein
LSNIAHWKPVRRRRDKIGRLQPNPYTPGMFVHTLQNVSLFSVLIITSWPVTSSASWERLADVESAFRVEGLAGNTKVLDELTRSPQADVRLAATFLLARGYASTGRADLARAAFKSCRRVKDIAEPAWRLLEAEILLAEGRKKEALARLKVLRRRFSAYRWAQVDLLYSRLHETLGKPPDIAATSLELLKRSRIRLPADELLDRAARATETFDAVAALRLWRRLAMQYPERTFAVGALEKIGGLAALSKGERLRRVERLFAARAYEQCRTEATELWKAGYKRAEVGFYLGKIGTERLRDDYRSAEKFLRVAAADAAPFALPALSSLAIVLMKLGRTTESVAAFDRWLKRHADAPLKRVVEAHYDRGRALHEGGKSARAAADLDRFLRSVGPGFDRVKYQWFVGFWYFQSGKYSAAITAMKPLLKRSNPLEGGKARYWTARALYAQNRHTAAANMLAELVADMPLTYYSALAEHRLLEWGMASKIPSRPKLRVGPVKDYSVVDIARFKRSKHTTNVRLGCYLGDAHAARFVRDGATQGLRTDLGGKSSKAFLAGLEHCVETYHKARYSAWRTHRKGALRDYPNQRNIAAWRSVYPKAFARYVEASAKQHGVPSAMVYAHMLQESRFNPAMISGAPAFGLMELLDRTARRLAAEAKEEYKLWMTMEPVHNIRWGAQYLGALYRKFHGQLPFAVASYNGGPMLMGYHVKQSDGQDFDLMVDDLGPHETRNYTRRVAEHMLRYLAIYSPADEARQLSDVLVPKTWHSRALPFPDY